MSECVKKGGRGEREREEKERETEKIKRLAAEQGTEECEKFPGGALILSINSEP